jgi:hypothetical protein
MFESDKTILAVYKSLDDENSGARGNEMQTAGSRKHSLRQQQEAGKWQRNQDAGWGHMGWRGDPMAGYGSTAVEVIRQTRPPKDSGRRRTDKRLWGACSPKMWDMWRQVLIG